MNGRTALQEKESLALLALVGAVLHELTSTGKHSLASVALSEWSSVALHCDAKQGQSKAFRIFFEVLRAGCVAAGNGFVGYAKTAISNDAARKIAQWMAKSGEEEAEERNKKLKQKQQRIRATEIQDSSDDEEESISALSSSTKEMKKKQKGMATSHQQMMVMQVFNRYLHVIGEPNMTLKRCAHRLYQSQGNVLKDAEKNKEIDPEYVQILKEDIPRK